MRAFPLLAPAAFALSVLGGCATTQSFSGTVAPEPEARFAPDATVQVMLIDQASGAVVSTESVPVDGRRTAIPFRLSAGESLAAGGRYALQARVVSRSGATLYQSARATPVTVPSSGSLVVTVEPAAAGGAVVGAR